MRFNGVFVFVYLCVAISPSLAPAQSFSPNKNPSQPGRPITEILRHTPGQTAIDVALDATVSITLNNPIDPNTLDAQSFFATVDGEPLAAERGTTIDRRTIYLTFPDYLPGDAIVDVQLDGSLLRDVAGRFVDADGNGYPGGAFDLEFVTTSPVPIPFEIAEAAIVGDVYRVDEMEIDPATRENLVVPFFGADVKVYTYPATPASLPILTTTTGLDGSFTLTSPAIEGSETFLFTVSKQGFTEVQRAVTLEAGRCTRVADAVLQQYGVSEMIMAGEEAELIDPESGICLSIPSGAFNSDTTLFLTVLDSADSLRSALPPLASNDGTFIDISGLDVFGEAVDCTDCAVTLTIPNEYNLPPGTQLPFGKVDHFTLQWFDLADIYQGTGEAPDEFVGEVSADGSVINVSFDHFCTICTSYCDPYPDTEHEDPLPVYDPNDPANICGNSVVNTHEGELTETISLPTFREMGREIGLSLVYQSSTAHPTVSIGSRVQYSTGRPVERTSFTFNIEGITTEATYGFSEDQEHHANLVWDGTDVFGDAVPTGAYPYTIDTTSLNAQAPIWLPATFGGAQLVDVGLTYPGLTTSRGPTINGHAMLVDRSDSEYGAGWSLSADQRLHVTPGGVMITSGGSRAMFRSRWYVGEPGSGPTTSGGTPGGGVLAVPPCPVRIALGLKPVAGPWCSVNFLGYESPPGDASTLTRDPVNGGWTRSLPDGTRHVFNDAGRLEKIEDRYGHQTVHEYDVDGRLTQITTLAEITTSPRFSWTINYDGNGKLSSIVDSASRQTSFVVDGTGNLVSVENAISVANGENALRTFEYDGHLLTAQQHPRGNRSEYSYTLGRVTEARAYDTDGTLLRTRSFIPNVLNNNVVTAIATGLGTSDNPIAVEPSRISVYIDGRGNPTVFEQNDFGATSKIVDSLGGVTELQYVNNLSSPVHGRLASAIGPRRLNRTDYSYDGAGNVTSIIQHENLDQPDNPAWSSYATTSIAYNNYGQPTQITDARGNTTQLQYDLSGNVLRIEDAMGQARMFSYEDPEFPDRMTKILAPDGTTTDVAYDDHGNVTTRTDELGRTLTLSNDVNTGFFEAITLHGETSPFATYAYDELNRVIQQTGGEQAQVLFDYGDASCGCSSPNLTKVTFDDSTTSEFEYDGLDRRVAATDQLGNTSYFEYGPESELVHVSNRSLEAIEYTYDALGRLTESFVQNGELTSYTYDAEGNITLAVNSISTLLFEHDAFGRVLHEDRELLVESDGVLVPQFHSISYDYDEAGNRTAMQDSGLTINYDFDDLNRLSLIQEAGGEWFDFDYDSIGRRTSLSRTNGIDTAYSYDPSSQLAEVTELASGGPIHQVLYEAYDSLGRLLQESTVSAALSNTRSYMYDDLGRLTDVSDSITFGETLDTATWNYDDANRVQAGDGWTYVHDTEGRLVAQTDGQITTSFNYDAAGQLRSLTETSAGGTQPNLRVEYRYDALGRRVTKSVNEIVSSFEYDGLDLIRHRGSRGESQLEFVCGPDVDEPLMVRASASGDVHYYHVDRLGGVRLLTNASGAVQEQSSYGAFGDRQHRSGPGTTQPFGFTGREWEPETELYYYRARYYDPTIGRFTVEDPVGINGGLNQYAYIGNRPINHRDPLGLTPCKALRDFVDYEQAHGKWSTVLKYNPLNSGLLIPLNKPSESIFGLADIDWGLRTSIGGYGSYVPLKLLWNTIRTISNPRKHSLGEQFTGSENLTGVLAIQVWLYSDLTLQQIFFPALLKCCKKGQ